MNNNSRHNPWGGSPRAERCARTRTDTNAKRFAFDRQTAGEAWQQNLRALAGAADRCRSAVPRFRAFATRWVQRMRSHWQRGTCAGKSLAVLYVLGGLAMLVGFAYLMVFLIPVLILCAVLTAVLAGLNIHR